MKKDSSKIVSWGVEPALNQALNYCIGEALVTLHNDKYELTDKGIQFCKKIDTIKELFAPEKAFLKYIGKSKVTEDFINKLTERLIIKHD